MTCLRDWPMKACYGCIVTVPMLLGLQREVMQFPVGAAAIERAMEFFKGNYQSGDLVVVDGPPEVNRFRYYAQRAALDVREVRCELGAVIGAGHINHLASLTDDDVIWREPNSAQLIGGASAASLIAAPLEQWPSMPVAGLLRWTPHLYAGYACQRLWRASVEYSPWIPPWGMRRIFTRTFVGQDGSHYSASLYERFQKR